MSDLRAALDAVRSERGTLTPRTVVDAWRPADHPEHDRLEWDDTAAGEAWRREQAHRLITSVRIKYRTESDDHTRDVRAFVAVPTTDSAPVYEPTEVVASDPMLRTIALRDAERQWRQLHARYLDLTEFIDMVRRDVAS